MLIWLKEQKPKQSPETKLKMANYFHAKSSLNGAFVLKHTKKKYKRLSQNTIL